MANKFEFVNGPFKRVTIEGLSRIPDRIKLEFDAARVKENAEPGELFMQDASGLLVEYEFDQSEGTYTFVDHSVDRQPFTGS